MMINEFMKVYRLKIMAYSPVHIGDSRDLEPTEYVICKDAAKASAAKEAPAFVICPECNKKNPVNARYRGECDTPLPQIKPTAAHNQSAPQNDAFLYTFTPKQLSEALKENNKWSPFCNKAKNGTLDDIKKFLNDNAEIISRKGCKRAKIVDFPQTSSAIAKHISNELTQQAYIPGSSIKGALGLILRGAETNLCITDAISKERFLTEIRRCFHSDKNMENKKIYAEVIPAGTVFEGEIRFKPKENTNTLGMIRLACENFRQKRQDNINISAAENSFIIRLGKYCGKAYKTTDISKKSKWSTGRKAFGWCIVEFEEVK